MKGTLILLFLLPGIAFAKKIMPNPCDSMKAIVMTDANLSATKICSNIEGVLNAHPIERGESFEFSKLDDSTIIGNGIMIMKRIPYQQESEIYGPYRIAHNSDGNISYKFYINCKAGKFKYEFTDLHHYNARYKYNDICALDYKSENFKEITGLRVSFLYRINDIVELMKKVNLKSNW